MYRMLLSTSAILLLTGAIAVVQAAAQDDQEAGAANERSPEEQFAAIVADYNAAMQEFRAAYNEAVSEARKSEDQAAAQKAVQAVYQEKYPKVSDYSGRFLKLAEQNATDPVAVKALGWIIQRAPGSRESDAAFGLLAKNHVDSDQLLPIVMSMTRAQPSEETEAFLKTVAAQNPDRSTQGMAKYALGKYLTNLSSLKGMLEQNPDRVAMYKSRFGEQLISRLMDRPTADFEKEVETLFEDVAANYGDVSYGRRTLADIVEGDLFEIKYLAIGKVAPDIEGEDLDGVPFKLSDYRGKVVVIDFWGDW